jgi:hypothetical protein
MGAARVLQPGDLQRHAQAGGDCTRHLHIPARQQLEQTLSKVKARSVQDDHPWIIYGFIVLPPFVKNELGWPALGMHKDAGGG